MCVVWRVVARVAAPVVEDGENTEGPSDSSDESDNDEALAPAAAPASDDDDEPIPLSVALDSKRSNAMAGYCFCLTGASSSMCSNFGFPS